MSTYNTVLLVVKDPLAFAHAQFRRTQKKKNGGGGQKSTPKKWAHKGQLPIFEYPAVKPLVPP